jgi:hypothetical protein
MSPLQLRQQAVVDLKTAFLQGNPITFYGQMLHVESYTVDYQHGRKNGFSYSFKLSNGSLIIIESSQ